MSELPDVVTTFLSSWSTRDAAIAAACVTDNVIIRDPHHDVQGPDALVKHLNQVLPLFDFTVTFDGPVIRDGDRVAFTCRIALTGRAQPFIGFSSSFEPAVFVELRENKIASWIEYWDPTAFDADMKAAATRP